MLLRFYMFREQMAEPDDAVGIVVIYIGLAVRLVLRRKTCRYRIDIHAVFMLCRIIPFDLVQLLIKRPDGADTAVNKDAVFGISGKLFLKIV